MRPSELGGTQAPIKGGHDAVTIALGAIAISLEVLAYIPDITMILEPQETGCAMVDESYCQ
jgi:hypothetical protein